MVTRNCARRRRACLPRGRAWVVNDYERFLRNPDIIEAERVAGCDQVAAVPNASPGFNASEGWRRRRLKMYVEQRAPVELERRDAFLRRLRRAVLHLNKRFRAEARRVVPEPTSVGKGVFEIEWCAHQMVDPPPGVPHHLAVR